MRIWIPFLSFLALGSPVSSLDFWSADKPETLIEAMTPQEWIGQILMFGYSGESAPDGILTWARDRSIGGIKIFGRNANNLAAMMDSIARLQNSSQKTRFRIPLFVATDQEGGWVRHVRGRTSQTPGNLAIGASGLPYDALQTGFFIGSELKALGINMNFAPTVDIYTNKEAHVIGPRAFGEDPLQTAILGVAFFKGQDRAGVISTAKHFPGHGNTPQDSHGVLPVIQDSLATLMTRELVPYQYLIREGLPAIMSGHLAFPQISGQPIPASLSPALLQDLLRQKLQFRNLLITDDLFMEGARPGGISVAAAAERALRAGNDMLMISMGQSDEVYQQVWNHINQLIQRDSGFKDRVKAAALQVLRIKLQYLRGDRAVPLIPMALNTPRLIPNTQGKSFFFDQAARSITGIKAFAPVSKNKSTLLITCYETFEQELRKRIPGLKTSYFDYNPFFGTEEGKAQEILKTAQNYQQIIFNLVTPGSVEILKALKPLADRITVVSVLTPVYLQQTPWVKSALAVYGTGDESFQACTGVLMGDVVPRGQLPVRLDP